MITQSDIFPLDAILEKCSIDTNSHISAPPVILSIKETSISNIYHKRLFTLGNFSCIIGKAKSKKTFLISLLTATLIKGQNNNMIGNMPSNKPLIVYFDTEQGEYDSWNVIKRITWMGGSKENLKAFNLRAYTPKERCEIIEHAFKTFKRIGYCVIDGVADLATGINDEDEATRVSSMLLRLTKEYGCHISTVIHQNKNDNFATGHLGSMVMKKAEIIISVNKTDDFSKSEVKCEMSRGADFEAFLISINDEGNPEIFEKEKKQKSHEITAETTSPF